MYQLEVNYERTMRIWWAYSWRVMVFSLLIGAVLRFICGFILGAMGKVELIGVVAGLLGYLVFIPVSIWVFKKILTTKYKTFSIALCAVGQQ